jgi:DNA-binding transcriptional LysR family regulator
MFPGNLRAFFETVRAGSVRKASDALNVAPSSISRQIAVLEREMGTTLFERRAGGMALTHAGELVADYARTMLVDYDTLRTDLDDLKGTQRRLLRVALVESIASHGPIAAVTRFRERFPETSFNLRLMPAPRVVEAVLKDQCDIGVSFCPDPHPDVMRVGSAAEPVVAAVRGDHPLANARTIALKALSDIPLALPDLDFGVRQILDRAAAAEGFRLQPVVVSNVFETLREFVRLGAGAAVLPYRAVAREAKAGGLVVIPLEGDAFRDTAIDLIVLRKRRLPRVVKLFVDMLAEEINAAA